MLLQYRRGQEDTAGNQEPEPVTFAEAAALRLEPGHLPQGKRQDHEGADEKTCPGEADGAQLSGTDLLNDKAAAPNHCRQGKQQIRLNPRHVRLHLSC